MKLTLEKKISIISLGCLTLGVILLGFVQLALANPFTFASPATSATATTTRTYMAVNTTLATTTVVYDSFEMNGTNQTNKGNTQAANKATLLIQRDASSTASVLNVAIEYSDDGIDWYQNNLFATASTSQPIQLAPVNSYTWNYASTTVGGAPVLAATASTSKAILIDTPLRFVRAVFSVTGANTAIWAKFVPLKERSE
jgi:hypothetical protein